LRTVKGKEGDENTVILTRVPRTGPKRCAASKGRPCIKLEN